ncbi:MULTISPECIES: ATP-binding protein [Streptomyces]|uniref:ATP-binding protein n=1 Tax=Streptomyces TaxID=1883 RepID=UPI00226EBAE8|nr:MULTISPECIES: ATP-binding protein [unclassified Streptomyces]MCY0923291.1 ATP-binding protein [Streptomyces sp. H27-G5]MCY0943966.1 ATP-binding protein [Streptomyces sp. H34-AA3]MCY0956314.1 ATP-binding protein [Streptomyces sp. H27-H5]MCZ4082334.1 ATP-binding protein [Streptomyces sp. H34-S5]
MAVSFSAEPHRVQQMRRLAGAYLGCFGTFSPEMIEVVQLLVSELVTNAIVHGETAEVGFRLSFEQSDQLRIEVDDHSAGTPEVRHLDPEAENGRGMLLVALFAQNWGRAKTSTWCTVSTGAVAA